LPVDEVLQEGTVMRTPLTLRGAITVGAMVVVVAGCSNPVASASVASSGSVASAAPEATVLWPAPPNPLELAVAAGLEPAPKEYLTNHVHAHLDVFIDGKPIVVPAGIGINIEDENVRRFNEPDGSVSYGGIDQCATPCISPLHTHDATGVIHTESQTPEPNTLGEFFVEWGVELTDSCVGEFCSPTPIAFYIVGEPYTGDPRAIELTDRKVIVIVIGTPPAEIPKTADFSKA
jgi:hypothetical protein